MDLQAIDIHEESDEVVQRLEKVYQTREELLASAKKFYLMQGYVISIKSSRKDKYVTIGCDRGGCYRDRRNIPLEERQRITASRLIDCPFEIQGEKQVDGVWNLEIRNNLHNHEPSKDMSGHPMCRRVSGEEIKSVHEMTLSEIAPRQILSSLRQKNPNVQAIFRTIYNAKAKIYKDNLGGRTSIQALFEELGQGGFVHNVAQDESKHLTHLFFAHPKSITLTRNLFNVFVMDCTYKTNKYKMPLLDIIGVSSFNTSFYSCFAFLSKEGEEDYIWALKNFRKVLGPGCEPFVIVSDRELALMKAIQVVFPNTHNLLCVWHINKNILSHCKHHFEEEEGWDSFLSTWNLIVYSLDEASFEEAWALFELLYKDTKEVISYIRDTWLPFKEKFIGAWTEKYLHFGNRVSSRAEGAHSKLKRYLQNSTSDRQVKDKICLAIKNEFEEIKTQLSSERLRTTHRVNVPFFKELNTHVSMFAMKELLKQYEMVKSGKMHYTCTGHFTATMGLPCSRVMILLKDSVLPLSSIHSQWRIDTRSLTCNDDEMRSEEDGFKRLLDEFQDKYLQWPLDQKENAREKISQLIGASLPSLLEPIVQVHKGRPSKKQRESSSTKRDPSKFEIVETNRRCSTCKGIGHNSRTCQIMTRAHIPSLDSVRSTMDNVVWM